jgi:RpiB/LacA/LacB family sugar-phosphate isomerase
MNIVTGSDHAGFELKAVVNQELESLGHTVIDVGAHDTHPSDYPDFAEALSKEIVEGRADRGVLVCGSGLGASIAANKVPGIRAGNCSDTYSAHQGVEHDDVNVLVLGSRVIGVEVAKEMVRAFLAANFSGQERHVRRLNKVLEIEHRHCH